MGKRFSSSLGSGEKIIIEDKEYNRQIVYNPKKDRPAVFNDKIIVIFNNNLETFIVDRDDKACSIVNYFGEKTIPEHLSDTKMVENIKKVISEEYKKKEEKTLKKIAKTKKLNLDEIGKETTDEIGELYTELRTGTIRNNLLQYYRLKEKGELPKKPEKYLKKIRKGLRKTDNLPAR